MTSVLRLICCSCGTQLSSMKRIHMDNRLTAIKVIGLAGLISLPLLPLCWQSGMTAANDGSGSESVVDANGELRVPAEYRTAYEFLGSWSLANDQGYGAQRWLPKAIQVVYASPGTIAAYRKDGHFPDGTVLVKENFEATTEAMKKVGTVSHAQKLTGWFVMVRDTKDSHPGHKLWGEGWGWSYFDVANPLKTTSTDFKKDCLECHTPVQASDWIHVDAYPPLRP
jgi:hypothetical protein